MAWSVVAGLLGVLGTWVGMIRLTQRQSPPSPVLYWILGVASLLPAWGIAFVGLFGSAPVVGRPEPSLSVPFILSSSAGLLGVILTDAAVRRLHASGQPRRPVTDWLLGVAALAPAWCIALLGLAWT